MAMPLRAADEDVVLEEALAEEAPQKQEEAVEKTAPDVEIEPSRASLKKKLCNCKYFTDVPYKKRRTTWGGYLGFQYGTFNPINYEPSFSTSTYDAVYTQKTGSVELVFGLKYNFFLGSLGAQITSGYFSANNGSTTAASRLTIIPVMAGVRYALDNIFDEPYVVPYASGGMYTGLYTESQQGLSVTGNSAFAPYYSVGAMFQLDWLDKDSHESGYEDFGLENTYLYVEARSFMAATNNLPDLSTPLQIFGGLQTEF